MAVLTARKDQLLARLGALTDRPEAIDAEPLSHDDKDWPDLATQRAGDEVRETIGLGAQEEIRAIRAARQRIEDGDCGMCQRYAFPNQPREAGPVALQSPIARSARHDENPGGKPA